MKITHVVCTDTFAGVEQHIARLAVAEHERGHEVTVIGGAPDLMSRAIGRNEVRLVAGRGVWPVAARIIDQRRTDVLNLHMTAAEIAATAAWPANRVPAVATRHFAQMRGQSSSVSRLLSTLAAHRVRQQIAVSRYVADHIEPPAIPVVSGVPSADDGPPAPDRDPVVLVVQRLELEKRTDDAIRAFAGSHLAHRGWTLDIAGSGSEMGALRRLTRDMGVDAAVRFLGHRSDVDRLMRRAGILLAPRTDEALGLTVLEAMSHGLPVLAAAGGGHLETIGWICPELTYPVQHLDHASATLAQLADDPAERTRVGSALQEAQRQHFTIERQARETECVYRSVLG